MAKNSTLHRVFCQRVSERRKSLGLTQTAVAERLGISQPAYAAIEGGRCSPSLDVVERVAAALETTPERLITTEKNAVAV